MKKRRNILLVMLVLITATALGPGCTRRFYRRAADREVDAILAEKDKVPFWKIANYHVYPDPRARFAYPPNPDRAPMPPDDSYAKDFAPNPQRTPHAGIYAIRGTGYLDMLAEWDALNRGDLHTKDDIQLAGYQSDQKTDPDAPAPYMQPGENGKSEIRPFLISLDQAVALGLVNSRDFQTRRENLYLTALPVTLERFAFSAQFFAASQAIRERIGSEAPGGPANRWRIGSTTGFSKLFSTGALLLVDFANDTIINLTGNRPHTLSTSVVNLDIIQPLLRGGGRAVTLEPLTQVERNLLYEIRSYARFRKEFYASVTGSPTGYLQVLRLAAELENERKNVQFLKKLLDNFRLFAEGGLISPLQVGDVELDWLAGQTQVLQREQTLRTALDAFKIQLGLEPQIPLELVKTEIEPLTDQFERFEKVRNDSDRVMESAINFDVVYDALKKPKANEKELAKLALTLRPHLRNLFVNSVLVRDTDFRTQFPKRWEAWNRNQLSDPELSKKMEKLAEERRRLQEIRDTPKGPEFSFGEQKRLEQVELELVTGFFEKALREYENSPWLKEENLQLRLAKHNEYFREVTSLFSLVLVEARQQRYTLVREAWPQPPSVIVHGIDLLKTESEKSQEIVRETALGNRLDLMNEQAFVVDAWRQLAVTANSLLGVFDVQYHMDSRTPPGEAKPLAFNGRRTTHQLILNSELPLVRKAERNQYRAAQIVFQQQRRQYMQAQDFVAANVRQQIRELRLLAENFKIEQRSVERAYLQVESGFENFRAPPEPGRGGIDTAQTTQLLNNQRNLLQRQNSLIRIWIDYLITRIQLYRDLELMPLNQQGVWIDEYVPCEQTATILPPS